jgi:hypothetical protein
MKDKELRELLDEEGFIYFCPTSGIVKHRTFGLKSKLQEIEDRLQCQIQDQQEQINFILNHLNLDIKKFKGYVEDKA